MNHLGFSQARLERIDRFLTERYIEPKKLAGTQLTIFRRGHIAATLKASETDGNDIVSYITGVKSQNAAGALM